MFKSLRTFSRKDNCDKHFKKLHLELKTRCELCGKEFKHLKQHIKHVHNDIRNHKCEICDKIFTRKQHLIEHTRVVHRKRHLWPCRSCDKNFLSRISLIIHYEKHHHGKSPEQQITTVETNRVTSAN